MSNYRTVALFATLLFAMSGVMARLHTIAHTHDAEAADAQSSLTVTVASMRGTLYDRNLRPLTNLGVRHVGSAIGTPTALTALSAAYGEEWDTLRPRLETGKPVVLSSESVLPLAQGILQFTVPDTKDSGTAAHILGYVDASGHGVCGAQYALDDVLTAATGTLDVTYRTDGAGRVLSGEQTTVEDTLVRASAGAALTIDDHLQATVEAVAGKHLTRGAAVVLEVESGDILAMASFPTYDTARVADYLDADGAPLYNRATAAYNCGSVFKTVTAMAALESGLGGTVLTCNGSVKVGKNTIRCHHLLGHGALSLSEAFACSCNPYFIGLSARTGGSTLYRYASLLGFDSPLFLMSGWQTERATLPKLDDIDGSVRLANVSIGQGDLLATPLHIAAMTACVAGGGEYRRPNLYHGTVGADGTLSPYKRDPATRVCSQTTAATLRAMMCDVMTDGTGASAAPTYGQAGGKTGTAETGWRTATGETMVHSWFTGFYPAEDPRYVVTVLAEDSETTGQTAAPAFKVICDALYRGGYVKIPS